MADYIYLLESRLSRTQQMAIETVRQIARNRGLTIFLVGGAVRDLTGGAPVRDLDLAVQGNALKLKKDLEKAGAELSAEYEVLQALYMTLPGGVRVEVGSTLSVDFPKPGKPVVRPANILDDLRRRDFTANAMALSLNEGSYGLLMDPLNGVADIENRELRLVSPYGFIEDPVRMIRGVRLGARLGWQMEEKTRARYETGKAEDFIAAMSAFQRGYEAEEIAREEDPLRVIRALEQDGWMKQLAPAWTSAKANVHELEKLREAQMQLQLRGIEADASPVQFPLLTAKMSSNDVKALKKSFPLRGFVNDVDALEGEGKRFAAELASKQAAMPAAAWKMLMGARPEVVLWAAYAGKNATLQTRFKSFYTDWPQARQKIPYTQMQEMRIVPGLSGYDELVEKLFFELMDGRLSTPEEIKAYLEPYSPPAPPPPVHLRRARGTKKETKASRSRKKATAGSPAAGGEVLDETVAAELTEAMEKSVAGDAGSGELPVLRLKGAAKKGVVVTPPAPAKAGAPSKAAEQGKIPDGKAAAKPTGGAKLVAAKAQPPSKPAANKQAVKTVAAKPVKKAATQPTAKAAKKVAAKPAKASAKPKSKPAAKKPTPGKPAKKKR